MDVLWLAYFQIAAALCTVLFLQIIVAPYGRYSSSGWGFLISARVAWFVQEMPALVIPIYIWLTSESNEDQRSWTNVVLMMMYLVHYIHRCLVYPFLSVTEGKPWPFFVVLAAFMVCTFNGYMQSVYLFRVAEYPVGWLFSTTSIAGILMFFVGMVINIHSDYILRQLRRASKQGGYQIPTGSMFEFVSCANYFGEILEWTGFALACQSLPAFSFALYSASNLGPRALQHHRWYKEKFDNYPLNRKALIPFLL